VAATETATIRVARSTRDLLAEQARARGVSLASLLADVARDRQTELIWRSERQASALDAVNSDVEDEDRVWEAVLVDGID
jgi:hypothetical protein